MHTLVRATAVHELLLQAPDNPSHHAHGVPAGRDHKQLPPPGYESTTAAPIPCIVFSTSSIQRIAGTCVVCAGEEAGACGRMSPHRAACILSIGLHTLPACLPACLP
ncbi:MAG: hypothetical protein EOO65_01620, partial [Methanosarcinales archaeon]